jgi:hypothetical protein
VRKAARFAVYEEIIISVKNHQMLPTILVEAAYMLPMTINFKIKQNLSTCKAATRLNNFMRRK